jgi:hypothetical protein
MPEVIWPLGALAAGVVALNVDALTVAALIALVGFGVFKLAGVR